jgi:hypothetical protein
MINPEELEAALLAKMIAFLNEDQAFLSSESIHEKCAYACRVLREEHKLEAPFSIIDQILGVMKGTTWYPETC